MASASTTIIRSHFPNIPTIPDQQWKRRCQAYIYSETTDVLKMPFIITAFYHPTCYLLDSSGEAGWPFYLSRYSRSSIPLTNTNHTKQAEATLTSALHSLILSARPWSIWPALLCSDLL